MKKTLAWFGLFVVVSIAMIALSQTRQIGAVGDVAAFFAPLQRGVGSAAGAVGGFVGRWVEAGHLQGENARLREENATLVAENVRLLEVERENERLRGELGLLSEHPDWKRLPANVIGREPTNLLQYLIIDKGGGDGVSVGQTVVSAAGLVGQVVDVQTHTAKVLTIIDPSSFVPALVQDSRADGLVVGEFWGRLSMRFIPLEERINAHDWVITSGLGKGYPKGLLIGQVNRIQRSDTDLFQEAEIAPAVNLRKLEGVLVILEGE